MQREICSSGLHKRNWQACTSTLAKTVLGSAMTLPCKGRCVACGGELSFFGPRLQYAYMRCRVCGSIQLHPMPDEAELIRSYEEEYASALHYEKDPVLCKKASRTYYESITNALRDYAVQGPILDYGTGWGGLCSTLIGKGFTCSGVEMSRQMAAYCTSRGLPVRWGGMESIRGQVFSAFVLCTVFEHLVDPDRWLTEANSLLAPDGFIFSVQPTALFANLVGRTLRLGNPYAPLPQLGLVFCPPWHTVFFSFRGMEVLARRNGFELLEIRPAPQGRQGGLAGLAQLGLEMLNRFGWRLVGRQWPLMIAHLFVLRKKRHVSP